MSDDTVADFSQHPNALTINRSPDIVAPGAKIVSAGVPGSAIYNTYPAARVGNGLIRGSGTSQAAAVASGAAALLFQKYPNALPDAIKELLRRTATPLSGASVSLQGKGELNVAKAITTSLLSVVVSQAQASLSGSLVLARPSTGSGPVELARGDAHVTMDGVQLIGEKDIMGKLWLSLSLASATTKGTIWTSDGSFNGSTWIGGSFATDTTSVAGKTWGGRTWSGRTWSGNAWSGRTWSGRTWSASAWDGNTWTSSDWTSPVATPAWASAAWSSANWK